MGSKLVLNCRLVARVVMTEVVEAAAVVTAAVAAEGEEDTAVVETQG